jgi:hypothetical protein
VLTADAPFEYLELMTVFGVILEMRERHVTTTSA